MEHSWERNIPPFHRPRAVFLRRPGRSAAALAALLWLAPGSAGAAPAAAEGDENTMFGNSIQINVDGEGRIYILDWDRRHIKVFSPEGNFLHLIGKKGQGPGEFGNIWDHRFDEDGNIYATDIVNNRVSFFARGGEPLKQVKIPDGIGAVVFLSNGNIYTTQTIREEESGAGTFYHVRGIYDPDFQPLVEFHRDKQEFGPRGGKSPAEFTADILSRGAFKPTFHCRVTPDEQFVTGFPAEYTIRIRDRTGKILKIIKKDHEPVKVGKKHRDYYFETRVIPFISRMGESSLEDDVRKNMRYPKFLPVYSHFVLMDDGGLFVVTESLLDEPAKIDLFDDQGVYVGRFETDVPCDHLVFRNGRAYAVAVIDDYRYVRRYRYRIENY